jgi:hypothetical protein
MTDLNDGNAIWVAMLDGYDDGAELLGAFTDMGGALSWKSTLQNDRVDSIEIVPVPIGGGTFDTMGGDYLWFAYERIHGEAYPPGKCGVSNQPLTAEGIRDAMWGGNPGTRQMPVGHPLRYVMQFTATVLAPTEEEAMIKAEAIYAKMMAERGMRG